MHSFITRKSFVRNILLTAVTLFSSSLSLFAEDFYVAQSALGTGSGTDANNAKAVTFFNTSANWGVGAGKISAGDTVRLVGTITTTLTVQGSGSSGSPVTVLFETGAKLSKTNWGINTAGAISISSKQFITIDGANTGIIECTGNGDALGTAAQATGIYLSSANNCTIKNLTIRNIYVHVYNTDNKVPAYSTQCIKALNSSNLVISNNVLNHAYMGVYVLTDLPTTVTGTEIAGNTISACSTAIVVSCGRGSGDAINNTKIYNNDIDMGLNWYDTPNNNHIDGIHTWTSGGSMTELSIYNNSFHGATNNHCTAYIYITDNVPVSYIYNNLIVGTPGSTPPGEGYINYNLTGTAHAYIFNNTLVGTSPTNTGGNAIAFDPSRAGTTGHVKNNLIANFYVGIYDANAATTWDSNNNIFYNCGNVGRLSTFKSTLASWQTATSNDMQSKTTNPSLNANYTIPTGSSAAGAGLNLLPTFSVLSSDKAGNPRSLSGAWDVGCYVAGGSANPITIAPSNPTITILIQ